MIPPVWEVEMTLHWWADRDSRGLQHVVLENDALRLTFLPELGGKLWSMIDPAQGQEILWHHPTLVPLAVRPGTGHDGAIAGEEVTPRSR